MTGRGSDYAINVKKIQLSLPHETTKNKEKSIQICPYSGTAVYPHMPIIHVASELDKLASARATPAWGHAGLFVQFCASGGAKFSYTSQQTRSRAVCK